MVSMVINQTGRFCSLLCKVLSLGWEGLSPPGSQAGILNAPKGG